MMVNCHDHPSHITTPRGLRNSGLWKARRREARRADGKSSVRPGDPCEDVLKKPSGKRLHI